MLAVMGTEAVAMAMARLLRLLAARAIEGAAMATVAKMLAAEALTVVATGSTALQTAMRMGEQPELRARIGRWQWQSR